MSSSGHFIDAVPPAILPGMAFKHPDGRIIYALEYRVENGTSLWVWLNEAGADGNGYATNEDNTRRIVTTKPGECLVHRGKKLPPVERVTVARSSPPAKR